MKALANHTFEEHPLTVVRHADGREVWIAREVGRALGYADGKRLSNKITQEWGEDFTEGTDYDVLRGKDLNDFAKLLVDGPVSGLSKTRRLLVLYEPGIHLACILTRKPVGRRLRGWLADEVLPSIRRTGEYKAPTAQPKQLDAKTQLRIAQEERLGRKEERLGRTEERRGQLQKERAFNKAAKLAKRLGRSAEIIGKLEISALEAATGQDLPLLHSATSPQPETKSPDEIAAMIRKKHGVEITGRVLGGVAITPLGIRGDPKHCETYQVRRTGEGVQPFVPQHRYYPHAVKRIVAAWYTWHTEREPMWEMENLSKHDA